ncbi:MAG: hypothetical protein ACHBN1_16665 [Heteroscytonema crispum UTEX LB 1556]
MPISCFRLLSRSHHPNNDFSHSQIRTAISYQPPTTNYQQRDRASPVAWVGKTPLRPLGRPQDRSGSPTKGAPSPTTNHQLTTLSNYHSSAQ